MRAGIPNRPSVLGGLWLFFLAMAPRLPRRDRTVILDLRPLQCGYAGKGIGRYTVELGRRLAEGLQASGRGTSGEVAWVGPHYRG
ncbi:MAG TPA: hypothetical protein VK465_08185, partial [Fibrobacteria bacterium]|nr:hypothetical protein [Fibrobacteria bacterium]